MDTTPLCLENNKIKYLLEIIINSYLLTFKYFRGYLKSPNEPKALF